jgi:hypothetical protein
MIPCNLDHRMCKREALEVEQRGLLLGGWNNKPLSCSVVLAGSSPYKGGSLVYNWLVTLAEARADRDSSRVYLSLPRVYPRLLG